MKALLNKLPRLLCYLVAIALGMKQLREPDVWWQLLSGRWMLQQGQVTHSDMFSYTMAGHSWVNVKWLYEVLIALLEKALGPEGVLLLQCMVNAGLVWLLFKAIKYTALLLGRGVTEFQSVLAVLLFFAITEYRMAGRPEMISHLLCALYLFIMLRRPQAAWKDILWLLPLQLLWANMHEGYPVGLVMTGTYAGAALLSYLLTKEQKHLQQAGRLAAIFIASVFIILLNPNGIVLWKQPFEIYRQVWANKYTTELYSWSNAGYWTLQAKWHVALLIAVLMYWPLRMRREKRSFYSPGMVAYLLLIPLFGYLSLTANRNIPFAQIILLPSVALLLNSVANGIKTRNEKLYAALSKRAFAASIILAAAFYIAVVSNAFYKSTGSANRYGIHISMLHNPTGAADFIEAHHIKGTPFSDYFVSSYLLWRMYPDFRSYIDLRDLDVFPVSFFDKYFELYKKPQLFHEADARYNFNYVVLSTSQLPALQMDLYWKEGYNMVYVDPVAVIFLKQNETNKPINDDLKIQKLFTWPQPADEPLWATAMTKLLNPAVAYTGEDESNMPIYAALFYTQVRNYPLAIQMLKPQLENVTETAKAYQTLAACYNEYAKVTNEPQLKQLREDSARMYMQQAEEMK